MTEGEIAFFKLVAGDRDPSGRRCKRGGSAYPTRERGGRTVVDLPSHDLDALLSSPQGRSWAEANPGIAVSMLAPDGVSSYSHDGVEYKVGDDRLVLVADHVASALRSHGFRMARDA
jgi:hypothetical protein